MMIMRLRGFTLIELMIAVAIVGIIASIAYPNYIEEIKKSKRADAKAALVSFANAMETWKMENNDYLGAGTPDGTDTGAPNPNVFSAQVPVSGGTKTYDLAIDAVSATTYTLVAIPVDTSEQRIWINSDGTKSW